MTLDSLSKEDTAGEAEVFDRRMSKRPIERSGRGRVGGRARVRGRRVWQWEGTEKAEEREGATGVAERKAVLDFIAEDDGDALEG